MPAQRLYGYRLAGAVYRVALDAYARCWLDRKRHRNGLPRGDAAQNSSGVIAGKTRGGDFVAVFRPPLRDTIEAGPDRNAFDRIQTHHDMRNIGKIGRAHV